MKAILHSAGRAARMFPATSVMPKSLLAIYDQPAILSAISTVMAVGADNLLVVGRPQDIGLYVRQLESGEQWGLCIQYAVQRVPRGTADAFLVAPSFLCGEGAILLRQRRVSIDRILEYVDSWPPCSYKDRVKTTLGVDL